MTGPSAQFEIARIQLPDDALLRFLSLAPNAMAQLRIDGGIVRSNALCASLLRALSLDGNVSNLFDVLQPVAPDLALRVRAFGPVQGRVCDGLHLQIDAGGPGRKDPQVLKLNLIKLDDERLMAVIDDVSLSFKRDFELRHSQAWIQTLITGISDYALLTLDHQGVIQEWGPGVRDVTGFDADATIGRSYGIFFTAPDQRPDRLKARLQEADTSGWSVEEGWMRRANGQRYWASCLIAPLGVPDVPGSAAPVPGGYSLIIRDVGDRGEAGDAERCPVLCDPLTGLLNRRAFHDSAAIMIERGVQRSMRVSILRFNIDDFMCTCDNHGLAAGDAVLRHLAAGLSSTFRHTDIVARWDGEAFVVLLPDTSAAQAEAIAQQLCVRVEARPALVGGVAVPYTVSGGVASGDACMAGLDELIKRADAAMYSARSRGRNRIARWHEAG